MKQKNKVLVIEDEASLRLLLEDFLVPEGYEVLTASNGIEGLRKTFSESPDVVLTDICMPEMDGMVYLSRVRSQVPASSLPIIVVSALGMERHIQSGFQTGATDYIIKPFRSTDLLMRIRLALQQKVDPRHLSAVESDDFAALEEEPGPGTELDMGKYRLVSKIGSGGMGAVYRAVHVGYQIEVALKVLAPEKAKDKQNVMRFLREVRIATQLDHPHVVKVFDVGLSQGLYYYAMEHLPPHSLRSEVRNFGALKEERVIHLGLQIASALSHMHREGYMHRDVKPDNILFETQDSVKLIDFGLACAADDARLTREGSFIGTPGFVAPENIQEYRRPEPSCDMYSLGATLYFAASGHSPFPGKGGSTGKLIAQVQENPIPLHLTTPGISRGFSRLVMKMMSKDPQKRFFCMEELADRLAECRTSSVVAGETGN